MSRKTCPECGKPFDLDHIPAHVRELAELAGVPNPVWYVGTILCPDRPRTQPTSDSLKRIVRRRPRAEVPPEAV